MGDVRFLVPYETIRSATDRAQAIQTMDDEAVVAALAVCSGVDEPLLANVLATEAMNRLWRTSAVVEGLAEAVLATDAEGRVRVVNAALERLLGVPRERLVGEDARDVLGLRDAEGQPLPKDGDDPILEALLAGRAGSRALVLGNAAAGPLPALVAAAPCLREGETLGAVVSILEESGRDRADGMRLEAAEAARREAVGRIRTLERILAAQEGVARAPPGLDAVLRTVAERAMGLTDAEGAAIEMPEGDALVYRAAVGTAAVGMGLRVPLAGSLSGEAFREGRPARSDDAQADPRVFQEGARKVGARSILVVPLMEGERRVGLLKVLSSQRGAFAEHHERTLQILGGFLSTAIARAAEQEALRESERQYRMLVENSPEPMAVHAEGRLLFLNRAAARVMGVEDPATLLGRSVMDFVHPDSRALVEERMRAVARSTEALPPAEERFVRLDGEVIDVEVVAMPVHYQGRQAIQLIFRDVSARKRAEEGLRRFNDELEGRVRERTQAFRETLRDLETFTNSASHDLRGPLRGVDALLEGAEDELAHGSGEEARLLVAKARRENKRAQRLVQDLLGFARSGQKELSIQEVDVTALAREVVQHVEAQGLSIQTRWLVQEGMRTPADRGLLRIALHNLLDNAAKYSARRPDAQVGVGAMRHEGKMVFHVRDNGIGIPRGEAHRLFGTFQRMPNAAGYEGTGLGLATVHRIVTRHGGRIWAEETPGGGATFRFTLDGEAAGDDGSP